MDRRGVEVMKNIKIFVVFFVIAIMMVLMIGCDKNEKVDESDVMSENFVTADELGILSGSDECSEIVNKAIAEGKSIMFGNGEFIFNDTVNLKNSQLIGSGYNSTKFIYKGNKQFIKADGQFGIKNMSIRCSEITGKEKQGERVIVTLGTNGGVKEGSYISMVHFGQCGTTIYEGKDAAPSQGFTMQTLEISSASYAAFDFNSVGRKNNIINNVYMILGNDKAEFTPKAAYFGGSEENFTLNQLNVEHFSAVNSVVFDGMSNLKASTIHIEGMDITNAKEGYIKVLNSSGRIDAISVYWSRVSQRDCSFVLLGDAKKDGNDLTLGMVHIKGVNDPAGFHGYWPVRGIKENGFRVVDRIDGSKNEYRVTVEQYVPFTFQQDWDLMSTFPCDDEEIVFLKKGEIKTYGTTAERPTKCLCKGYSKYFDTTLQKTVTFNGKDWE